MAISYSLALPLGLALFVWFARWRTVKRPPGPKPYPLVGNLFDFPAVADMVSRVQAWKQDFGNIVYLSAFGKPLVILNDLQTVTDLFEKRGALYSGRPRFPMVGELCGFDRLPAIASDGTTTRLRNLRKVLNSEIGAKNCEQYEDCIENEVVAYLNKLLDEPEDFMLHNRWFAVDTIMLISYGYRVALKDDYHMAQADHIMHKLSRDAQPGAWLVDLFPFMRHIPDWVPGTHFKTYARKTRHELDDWVTKPWELVKSRKITTPSFSSRLMDLYPEMTPEEEDLIMWSAASIYSAGSDTSVSALTTFFLAMAMFPEVQKVAQLEIDTVTGSDKRLPGFSDQLNLPYTCALLLEIFRWGSILPLGAPRRPNEADVYEGYEIPKDATVMANIWGICHDPEVYPNPMDFNPSRFLGPTPQPDPRDVVFGFGRRICPGKFLAEKTLYTSISTTLSMFHIAAISSNPPKYEFDDGFISHPKPFKCSITPRSSEHENLLRSLGTTS
ncbi:hypothetical protein Hypma_008795 [Hypsizygus marmoreus]|uniref:O-methylsterigmatocystin oxidoreductase n=1 Tax=Hypsizygus marmoreus TaxID=39966 RepID=A0A369JXB5_HYPMA|nr:hypothetical protein Hypma_008795 [Hypsizygus marmoreus]